jgi:serine protease Do
MFARIKKYRISFAVTFVLVGIIIGLGIAVKSNLFSKLDASSEQAVLTSSTSTIKGEIDIQSAFIKVAEMVGPAVVSIVTETTRKIPTRRYYFGPPKGFFDKDFEGFFKDFFGETPEREFKQQGLGSGVIIDEQGYIITNEHVVSDAGKITAILSDGRRFEAEVRGSDPRSDIAVIKIKADNLPVARLGDSDYIKTGQWVVAIGNPFGFVVNNPKPTVTVGVISALHRSLPLGSREGRNYIDLIQTDAAINPGNSGGPLCDLDGNIIGLNVAIYSTTGGYQGIGFAIPANALRHVLGDLIEGRKILYGWLGVTVQELSHDMAEYFNIGDRKGAIVIEVIKDGPADKGGMKTGDIIRTLNGKEIDSLQTLLKHVGQAEVNKKAKVGILRDGKEMTLTIQVGERPPEKVIVKGEPKEEEVEGAPEAEKWRGLTITEITDEIAQRHGVEKQPGVIILKVDADSPAYEAGLRKGLIIKEINKIGVNSIDDYNAAVKIAKGKALVRTDKGYVIVRGEEN